MKTMDQAAFNVRMRTRAALAAIMAGKRKLTTVVYEAFVVEFGDQGLSFSDTLELSYDLHFDGLPFQIHVQAELNGTELCGRTWLHRLFGRVCRIAQRKRFRVDVFTRTEDPGIVQ